MLSLKEYQSQTLTQLSEDQQNLDNTKHLLSPQPIVNRYNKFNCNIQNLPLKSPNENFFKSESPNKNSQPKLEKLQYPLQKSQGKLSNRNLRMKKKNKLQKSQSHVEHVYIYQIINKIRRRSGYEPLSDKQVRMAFLYPITYVAFHLQQKESKRNEMRKKTIFKRMSSILIKHSNNLKSQTIIGALQQKVIDETPSKLVVKPSNTIQNQFQKSIKCLKESEELFYNIENSEKVLSQKEAQRNSSPKINKNQKSLQRFLDYQKVVLDISKKQRKTFISIQNYVNERSKCNQTKSIGLIESQIHFQYQNLKSLTETDTSSPIKLQTIKTQRKYYHIKSLSNLQGIKEVSKYRLNNFNIQQSAQIFKNVYILSSNKSKQISDKLST
ncbi:unnamed protein product (macronuclear) [Paramecium tetraurelia]|uniref:Uncharacterized protein n=1 Tax=Paramecium tetraurelia TaxID=5888 RepID=A0CUG1_PARTE|nr:uncharacterized protein GSPATT00010628001 [Paramecium tetraurelia]CAK74428.1 unnamed protein product [Paramecium tetraurelia]|eukprot:XP_001441825.1 hypothetical protein (macronuclear) [Paramecium tetraurelia strain d4-2]